MEEKTIDGFRAWYLGKIRKSKGTADKYTSILKNTPELDLSEGYSKAYEILNGRVKSRTSLAAHLSFLRYLDDQTVDEDTETLIARLISKLGKNKPGTHTEIPSRERMFTFEEYGRMQDFVRVEKTVKTGNNTVRNLSYCERLQRLLALKMLYDTAGRAEEVRRYEHDMILVDNRELKVPARITKRKKSRTADLHRDTIGLYMAYRERCGNKGKIFTCFKNYRQLLAFIKHVGKEVTGRNITVHYFRNSFVTHLTMRLLKKGKSIGEIIEIIRMYLGHENTKMSRHYVKLADEMLRERVIDD